MDRLKGFDPGELKDKIIKHNFVEGVASMTRKPIEDEKKVILLTGLSVQGRFISELPRTCTYYYF